MEKRRDYHYWIGRAVAELTAWGYLGDETLDGFRRHGIDRVQVELGWADLGDDHDGLRAHGVTHD